MTTRGFMPDESTYYGIIDSYRKGPVGESVLGIYKVSAESVGTRYGTEETRRERVFSVPYLQAIIWRIRRRRAGFSCRQQVGLFSTKRAGRRKSLGSPDVLLKGGAVPWFQCLSQQLSTNLLSTNLPRRNSWLQQALWKKEFCPPVEGYHF
jgi:hypothetical protein